MDHILIHYCRCSWEAKFIILSWSRADAIDDTKVGLAVAVLASRHALETRTYFDTGEARCELRGIIPPTQSIDNFIRVTKEGQVVTSVLEAVGSSRAEERCDDVHLASAKASIWRERNHASAIVFEMPVCCYDIPVGRVEEYYARTAGGGGCVID